MEVRQHQQQQQQQQQQESPLEATEKKRENRAITTAAAAAAALRVTRRVTRASTAAASALRVELIQNLPNEIKLIVIAFLYGPNGINGLDDDSDKGMTHSRFGDASDKGMTHLMMAVANKNWTNIILNVQLYPLLFTTSSRNSSNNNINNNNNNDNDNTKTKKRKKKNIELPIFDINTRSKSGFSALHFACGGRLSTYSRSSIVVAKYLIRHGANVNLQVLRFGPNRGCTPLHLATEEEDGNLIQLLLDHNANINVPDNQGDVPLHYAAIKGHSNLLQLLLDHNADVNVPKGPYGSTSLHIAAKNDHVKSVQLLLDHNANINVPDKEGNTPLHDAVYEAKVSVVQVLLANNNNNNRSNLVLDINATNNRGETPLHIAAERGMGNIVQLLTDHNANVNVSDNRGNTPLHLAFLNQGNRIEKKMIVSRLIECEAIVDHVNNKGCSPLLYAIEFCRINNGDAIQHLIDNGAKTTFFMKLIDNDPDALFKLSFSSDDDNNNNDNDGIMEAKIQYFQFGGGQYRLIPVGGNNDDTRYFRGYCCGYWGDSWILHDGNSDDDSDGNSDDDSDDDNDGDNDDDESDDDSDEEMVE